MQWVEAGILCTGWPFTTKDYPVHTVGGAEVENRCLKFRELCEGLEMWASGRRVLKSNIF